MGDFLELIYGILFQPAETLRDISRKQALGQSIAILVTVTLFTAWTGYFTLWSKAFFVIANILLTLFMWFFGSAIAHLVAELLGGCGSAKGLLAAYGYVQIPRIFSVPIFVFAAFFSESVMAGVLIITGFILVVWEFILRVIAIRETYAFSTGRAVLTLVAPFAVLLLCIVALGLIAASAMMKTMPHMGFGMIPFLQ
jgi:hypothetical protein